MPILATPNANELAARPRAGLASRAPRRAARGATAQAG
jgi:hypothetical protein